MANTPYYTPRPDLDLVFERTVPVPPDKVWAAWTRPELLVQWFTPAPWKTVSAVIDLRPGGLFRTVMASPEGKEMPHGDGCFLDIVENRRLVWTTVLGPGYRPTSAAPGAMECDELPFTGLIMMEPAAGGGTHYTAVAMHRDPGGRSRHQEMGFEEGWGKAYEQMVALLTR